MNNDCDWLRHARVQYPLVFAQQPSCLNGALLQGSVQWNALDAAGALLRRDAVFGRNMMMSFQQAGQNLSMRSIQKGDQGHLLSCLHPTRILNGLTAEKQHEYESPSFVVNATLCVEW